MFCFLHQFILFRPLFWLVNLKSFWYFSVSVYDDKASSCVFVFSVLVNIDNICHWCRKVSQEKQESRRKHLLLKARNTINFFFLPFSQQETWAKYCFRLHNLPFQITRIIWRFHQRHLWGRDLTRKVMFFLFYKTVHIKPVTHFALNGRLFVCTQDTQKEHHLVWNTCYMWKQNTQGTLKTKLHKTGNSSIKRTKTAWMSKKTVT